MKSMIVAIVILDAFEMFHFGVDSHKEVCAHGRETIAGDWHR